MSTITKEFTKEQLQQIEAAAKEVMWPVVWSEKKAREHFSEKITPKVVLKLARIALASLEAEPVAYVDPFAFNNFSVYRAGETDNKRMGRAWMWANPDAGLIPVYTTPPAPVTINAEPVAWLWSHRKHPSEVTLVRPEDDDKAEGALWSGWSCQALYAAPPATVSVPDFGALTKCIVQRLVDYGTADDDAIASAEEFVYKACRAAMLQGAEPVTTAYKLPDDFDFDRFNDVVWLEVVASNPHMHSPTTSTIAMVALELNRKLATGNSSVIPDGWVACSERMPDDEQEVLTRNKMGHCFVSFFDEHSGLFFDRINVAAACCIEHILVTHWMPLPAAPLQEVKS